MARLFLVVMLFVSTDTVAQVLWGHLVPGPNPVGFKLSRQHDNTRNNRRMLVSTWYPAKASASAKTVLFKDYLAAGVINQSFSEPTEAERKGACDELHEMMERPFLFGGIDIPDDRFAAVLELPTAAKWNLDAAPGKFPTVLVSTEPESLSITAEFLASNGFVVVAVNAPYGGEQPPDSLLWVEPTEDLLWLVNHVQSFPNVDQGNISCMGFGGGIQSAFYTSIKSDKIKSLVNLEGGVFGPRSRTSASVDYAPEKMKAPMLHIVTSDQRKEDDITLERALVNTTLYRAFIQHEGLYHHDFSVYGRVLNKGLKMRGQLSDIADQTYVAVHKLILEFLKKPVDFPIDRRFMPFVSLEKFSAEPGLVLYQTGMDRVTIEQSRNFKTVNDTSLVFDIYYPEGFNKKIDLPVVVFVNGGGLEPYRWKIYQDWAKLIATNGLIAVNYQTRRRHALEDSESILDYLGSHAKELSIDKEKIGLWSCSGNVGTGLPLAMQESRTQIKSLVVYYGMIQTNPNAHIAHRQDLEIQIVRAGLDFHNLNAGIETFVKIAMTEDLHFEYINYPEAQHAFDAFDDTPRTREIILQTVEFLKRTLSKDHSVPAKTVLTNSRLWNMIVTGYKVDDGLKELKEALAMYRKMPSHTPWYNHIMDERNLNEMGYKLLEMHRIVDALKVFTANQEMFPESANAYDALGDAYAQAGDKQKAVANAKKALEKLSTQKDLQPTARDAIRKSAEEKIKKFQ